MRRTKLQSAPEAEAVPIEEPAATKKNRKPTTKTVSKNTQTPQPELPVIVENKTIIDKPVIAVKQSKSVPHKKNNPPTQTIKEVVNSALAAESKAEQSNRIADSTENKSTPKVKTAQPKQQIKVTSVTKTSLPEVSLQYPAPEGIKPLNAPLNSKKVSTKKKPNKETAVSPIQSETERLLLEISAITEQPIPEQKGKETLREVNTITKAPLTAPAQVQQSKSTRQDKATVAAKGKIQKNRKDIEVPQLDFTETIEQKSTETVQKPAPVNQEPFIPTPPDEAIAQRLLEIEQRYGGQPAKKQNKKPFPKQDNKAVLPPVEVKVPVENQIKPSVSETELPDTDAEEPKLSYWQQRRLQKKLKQKHQREQENQSAPTEAEENTVHKIQQPKAEAPKPIQQPKVHVPAQKQAVPTVVPVIQETQKIASAESERTENTPVEGSEATGELELPKLSYWQQRRLNKKLKQKQLREQQSASDNQDQNVEPIPQSAPQLQAKEEPVEVKKVLPRVHQKNEAGIRPPLKPLAAEKTVPVTVMQQSLPSETSAVQEIEDRAVTGDTIEIVANGSSEEAPKLSYWQQRRLQRKLKKQQLLQEAATITPDVDKEDLQEQVVPVNEISAERSDLTKVVSSESETEQPAADAPPKKLSYWQQKRLQKKLKQQQELEAKLANQDSIQEITVEENLDTAAEQPQQRRILPVPPDKLLPRPTAQPAQEKKILPVPADKQLPQQEKKILPVPHDKVLHPKDKKHPHIADKNIAAVPSDAASGSGEMSAPPLHEKKKLPVPADKLLPVKEQKILPVPPDKLLPKKDKKAPLTGEKKILPVPADKVLPPNEKKILPVPADKVLPPKEKKVLPFPEKASVPMLDLMALKHPPKPPKPQFPKRPKPPLPALPLELLPIMERVEKYILKELNVHSDSTILLGVSGGVDSMAMLDIMAYISLKHNFLLHVAHCNHHLRGNDSMEDEKLVRRTAANYGFHFHHTSLKVEEFATRHKLSIEQAARTLRYQFFERMAKTTQAELVATAHTADDSAETFLLNLLRGSGLTGLAGIPPRRELTKKIHIIRPLLPLQKSELYNYAKVRDLHWREDASNTSLLYTRNKVRLQLLPSLKEQFSPAIVEILNRTARLLHGADELITEQADLILPKMLRTIDKTTYALSISFFDSVNDFLKGEILQKILVEKFQSQPVSMQTIDRIIALEHSPVNSICEVTPAITAFRDRTEIIFQRNEAEEEINHQIGKISELKTDSFQLILKEIPRKEVVFSENPNIEFFDADLLPLWLTFRNWKSGDRIQPLGMTGTMTVGDFLTNEKVSLIDKKKNLVLCTGSEIVWVCSRRASDKFKVTPTTKRVIRLEYIPKNQQHHK